MIIKISAKCSDLFSASCDAEAKYYDGYVPDFFPETHYGDYVELTIDTATGQILNWPKDLKDSMIREQLGWYSK